MDPHHVSALQAIVLGIIQGATEFLPVSSTAHMRVIPALFGWGDLGAAFSAVVQLGPIVAIILYFRGQLAGYLAGIGRSIAAKKLFPEGDKEARLGWYTIFGTIPLIIAGLALEKKVDTQYRNLYLVAGALILLALILLYAEKVSKRNKTLENLTFGEAMTVGLAQMLALVPGASRSGCTITAGLFCGLTREDAADFSFLLSIPAITLAGVYKLYKVGKTGGMGGQLPMYVFSAVVAGLVAYVVIKLFLDYMKDDSHSTKPFIYYRIALGIVLIILAKTGTVTPESLSTETPAQSDQPAASRTVSVRSVALNGATSVPSSRYLP